jgi:hypothetical protein
VLEFLIWKSKAKVSFVSLFNLTLRGNTIFILHEETKEIQIFMQCAVSALPAVSAVLHTCWAILTTKE